MLWNAVSCVAGGGVQGTTQANTAADKSGGVNTGE